ncbi:MAG: hypothetical protein GXO74_00380 [Calditrichaeota bacterium]|nr:hypothetical protein [Calditrichota bacterium]
MAKDMSKGSIILEILIVILVVALIATILYPKKIWEQEEKNTQLCRSNMDRILKAELVFQKYHNTYTDSLPELVSFIRDDSTKQALRDYFYADTALAENLLTMLRDKEANANLLVENILADTLFFSIMENVNYDSNLAHVLLNRLTNTDLADTIKAWRQSDSSEVVVFKQVKRQFPALSLYNPMRDDDSLKLVFARMMPEVSTGFLLDTLYATNAEWAKKVDSAVAHTLENFVTCPTVGREYIITVTDTSVIKYVSIACPLDSTDIEASKKDFVKYHLGHLRLKNHGRISETGEKSWTK